MSHDGERGLVDNLHRLVVIFGFDEVFDVPDLNGVVLTCTHELICLSWSEVDAADILVVALE